MSHKASLPSNSPDRGVTVLICETCRTATDSNDKTPGSRLADFVREALSFRGNDAPLIRLETVACLGNCKRRLSAALLLDGGWSYVFGDLTPESGPDLIVGAELFLTTTDGILPWRGRPASLKQGLVARLPPLPSRASPLKDIP
jgi:predicted metal-binding protein